MPPLAWLDQRHSLHILRILQEAFTNVIKHAGASEIIVTTGVHDGCVCVGVADNGKGLDVAAAGPGRGLGNQARRAEVIGGRVELLSGGQGTRFTLLLPVGSTTHRRQPPTKRKKGFRAAIAPDIPLSHDGHGI